MVDERDLYGVPARRRTLGPLILVLLAFAGGLLLAGVLVHRSDRVARLLHPEATPPMVTAMSPPQPAMAQAPLVTSVDPAAGAALDRKLDVLAQRIAVVDAHAQAASGDADRAEGLLVAFAARRAIDRGQPLGYIEGMLRTHFGGGAPQAVAMVIGAAQRPVTILHLQIGLDDLAPALAAPGPQESWWTGVRRELGNLFVVRSAQTPSTEPDRAQVRAAMALEQGQVETALVVVARMPGAARAGAWIAEARRYVLAHNALDRIEAAALLPPAPTAVSRPATGSGVSGAVARTTAAEELPPRQPAPAVDRDAGGGRRS